MLTYQIFWVWMMEFWILLLYAAVSVDLIRVASWLLKSQVFQLVENKQQLKEVESAGLKEKFSFQSYPCSCHRLRENRLTRYNVKRCSLFLSGYFHFIPIQQVTLEEPRNWQHSRAFYKNICYNKASFILTFEQFVFDWKLKHTY